MYQYRFVLHNHVVLYQRTIHIQLYSVGSNQSRLRSPTGLPAEWTVPREVEHLLGEVYGSAVSTKKRFKLKALFITCSFNF